MQRIGAYSNSRPTTKSKKEEYGLPDVFYVSKHPTCPWGSGPTLYSELGEWKGTDRSLVRLPVVRFEGFGFGGVPRASPISQRSNPSRHQIANLGACSAMPLRLEVFYLRQRAARSKPTINMYKQLAPPLPPGAKPHPYANAPRPEEITRLYTTHFPIAACGGGGPYSTCEPGSLVQMLSVAVSKDYLV